MKKITLLLLLFTANVNVAQEKMTTAKGVINFEASVPLFEEVKAKNEEVTCVLIPKKSELSFVVIIKKFQFKRDLMKEHFNSNYIESDQYPKATFKGIIQKFDMKDLNEIEKEYQITGKLEIHGVTKKINVKAKLKKMDKQIGFTSNFILNPNDFKIEIPTMIIAKIAKNVNTEIACVLK